MKNPFNRQSQFELFPGTPGVQPKRQKASIFGCAITLSFENMILLGIIFVMGMVVAFSFGVEQGRRMKKVSVQEKQLVPVSFVPADQTEKDMEAKVSRQVSTERSDIVKHSNVEETAQKEENIERFEKKVDKTPSLEKIHTIQVASFKQKNRAEREAGDLQEHGYDAFIMPKGSYYIVCVGQFEERQQAQSLLRVLRKKYSDCYIRSL